MEAPLSHPSHSRPQSAFISSTYFPSVSNPETPPTKLTPTLEESPSDEHQVEEDPRPRPLGEGQVVESEDTILLENVPIITPNRDVVVKDLSFQVRVQSLLPPLMCTYMYGDKVCMQANTESRKNKHVHVHKIQRFADRLSSAIGKWKVDPVHERFYWWYICK